MARLLSLPIKSEEPDASLESFKDKVVYVKSFTVSQKDMLESAFRVTGTKESEWTITKEPSVKRYTTGLQQMKEGNRIGFAKMLYTRIFYKDGYGDIESKGTLNKVLELPEEDIDEATRRAIARAQEDPWA